MAAVFRFRRTSSARLLQRLKARADDAPWIYLIVIDNRLPPPFSPSSTPHHPPPLQQTICHAEGLPLESTALGALAEASGNDVRACLNGLQLFKARIPALLAAMPDGGCVCLCGVCGLYMGLCGYRVWPNHFSPPHLPHHHSSGQQLQGAAMTARLSRELLAYIGRGLKDQERDLLQVDL